MLKKAAEKFSWTKLFSGFTSAVGWAKTTVMIVKIVMVLAAIGVPVLVCKSWYAKGYQAGKAEGYKTGYTDASDWFAAHPIIQTGDNAVINNNVQKPDNRFKFNLIPPVIGWCA